MSGIWSWLYQLVLLVVATFAFMVLLAHGPTNFFPNAARDFNEMLHSGAPDAWNLGTGK